MMELDGLPPTQVHEPYLMANSPYSVKPIITKLGRCVISPQSLQRTEREIIRGL